MAQMTKSKRWIWMIFVALLCIPLMILTVVIEQAGTMPIGLLDGILTVSSFNGVISALITMLCIIIVSIDHNRGTGVALTILGVQLLSMTRTVVMTHNYTPLPGMVHNMVIMIVMLILNRQFDIRKKESVTDDVTGLVNRRGLMELLADLGHKPYYLLFIDLNDFKFINDSYGHRAGNQALRLVAERMRKQLGKKPIISRVGGDEFVVVLPWTECIEDETTKLLSCISEKFTVVVNAEEVECRLKANVGIASCPDDSRDPDVLLKYADMAMYRSKELNTKHKYLFFSKELEDKLKRRAELEDAICKGLEKDWFYLVYQPQYSSQDKRLRGFETLLRMKTDDGTFISPGEFIPVAEQNELIMTIDEYVLRRAMREFCDVVKQCSEPITISVNVSAKNICRRGFAEMVLSMLAETGFPCENLEIEITEYCFVQTFEVAEHNIRCLKEKGIKVALDDFGTGYASLAYLTQLSIDLLKIDKSFIDTITTQKQSLSFVEAVISIGHINGCEVISEGVELEEQLGVLRDCSCDFIQGYVWSRPLPYADAVELAKSC